MDKKFLGFDCQVKSIDEGERAITALISTAARDRMDEVLLPEGADLKNFRKNPVVLLSHNYSQPPIGRAMWIRKMADGILSKVQFAKTQIAEDVYNLYKDGFMKAFSVGFMPKEWEDGDGKKSPRRTYSKWELIEYSAVPVPANPEALALALEKGIIKSDILKKEFKLEEDADIHLKPEETDDYIRIPVRDCKVTATIDISKKEGIKALYCGGIKKVRTYLFLKAKGWTMEKAKAWVKDHEKGKDVDYEGVEFEIKIKDTIVTADKGSLEALEMLDTELQGANDENAELKLEIAELRYQLYVAGQEKPEKTVLEMTEGEIAEKIGEITLGVIKQVTGKVS